MSSYFQILLPEILLFLFTTLALFVRKKEIVVLVGIMSVFILHRLSYISYMLPTASHMLPEGLAIPSCILGTLPNLVLIVAALFIVQLIAVRHVSGGHISIICMFSLIGALLGIKSVLHNNLLMLYLAVEIQSVGMYSLPALNKNSSKSLEGSVKYVMLGTFMSAVMIYGISLIFVSSESLTISNTLQYSAGSATHGLGIILFSSALMFKLGAAPFHLWVADVYYASHTIVTSFFALLPKASLVILLALIASKSDPSTSTIQLVLWFSAILSLFFGTFCALRQANIKKFLAYASIVHVGFMLLAVMHAFRAPEEAAIDCPCIFTFYKYLCVYLINSFGIFSFVLMLKQHSIESLSLVRRTHPVLAFCALILFISSSGIPPFSGFVAKLLVLFDTLLLGLGLPTVAIALLLSIVSSYYYLRIARELFLKKEERTEGLIKSDPVVQDNKVLQILVVGSAILSVAVSLVLIYEDFLARLY